MKRNGVTPCPHCNGIGMIRVLRAGVIIEQLCAECDGTGAIEHESRRPIIEERWTASKLPGDASK